MVLGSRGGAEVALGALSRRADVAPDAAKPRAVVCRPVGESCDVRETLSSYALL